MARTGRPAVRHVAAVERAFAVLDALADGGELGTNEIARRTGINASTVSRLLATLASARFVEHVHGDRPVSPLSAADRARQRGARAPRPARARAAAPAGTRARDRRDGDAVGTRGARRDHRRLRAQRLGRPERRPARPAERRPRDGDRARSCSRSATWSFPAEPLISFTPRTITTRRAARSRSWHGVRARVRRRARGARGGACSGRGSRCGTARRRPGRDHRRSRARRSRFDENAARCALLRALLLEHTAAVSIELGWHGPDDAGVEVTPPTPAARRDTRLARGFASSASRRSGASAARDRPDDEEARRAFGDELEQRLDRPRAAQSQPLDIDREGVRELGRRSQRILDLLRADVLVLHRERRSVRG